MQKNLEKIKPGIAEVSEFEALELKANLNPEQRAYLEVLKDKMKKILGNKTKQELAKAGDLISLRNYKGILEDILEFLRTKNMKRQYDILSDDPELKKEQIRIIDIAIDQINSTPSMDPGIIGKLKALNIQKEIIAKSREMKTEIIDEEDVRIDAGVILAERGVWDEIKKIEPWPEEDYFLIKRAIDAEGNLLHMYLGVAGHPEQEYAYILKGIFGRSFSSGTNIDRVYIGMKKLETEWATTLAEYNEKEKKWIEKVAKKK